LSEGIDFLKENADVFDIVFDATSAYAHAQNNSFFSAAAKFAIDLTPARIGAIYVPSINLSDVGQKQNINLITCGGQASLPLVHALKNTTERIDYIEVVSTISAASAGLATRENINLYSPTKFTKTPRSRCISLTVSDNSLAISAQPTRNELHWERA
jgi:acetaldehyde dehydrogenase